MVETFAVLTRRREIYCDKDRDSDQEPCQNDGKDCQPVMLVQGISHLRTAVRFLHKNGTKTGLDFHSRC